jgi:hypothetical protein
MYCIALPVSTLSGGSWSLSPPLRWCISVRHWCASGQRLQAVGSRPLGHSAAYQDGLQSVVEVDQYLDDALLIIDLHQD